MIELGKVARDKMTGFEGVVMAKTEYLYGCTRWGLLNTKLSKEGAPQQDYIWFDEPQLDYAGPTPFSIGAHPSKAVDTHPDTGGPRQDAPSR